MAEHITPAIKIGDSLKVFLPGESPWAEVLEICGPFMRGRIDNKLFSEYSEFGRAKFTSDKFDSVEPLPKLHDFKKDDEIWFERAGEPSAWQPIDEAKTIFINGITQAIREAEAAAYERAAVVADQFDAGDLDGGQTGMAIRELGK